MAQAKATWAAALAEAGCYGFLEDAASSAVALALELCPDAAPLVGEDAREDLRKLCLTRLSTVYERPLIRLALRRVGLSETLALSAGEEERARAMRDIAERARDEIAADAGVKLRAQLAFAPDYEAAIARAFSEAVSELLMRLLSQRDEISEKLLEGRAITCIEGFSASGADSHRHGRMVMRIDTDAGSFFYKPHDCSLDVLYGELVAAGMAGCARAAAVVRKDGFAFIERLTPEEPIGQEGLRAYWRNLGSLTALFHGLGSRDMTFDNLMCCGERPAVLDLETLLVGEMSFTGVSVAKDVAVMDMSAEQLADSVACTAVLPLHAGGLIASPLVVDNASGTCLPHVNGKPATVRGFERDFVEGFEEGYRRLMCHRDEVFEMIGRHREAVCRQILINTQAYAQTRALLFSPQALSDASKRDAVLAELNAAYGVFPADLQQAVAEPDAAALLEGDVPYYCAKACSRTLFAGDGRPLGELLARSPLEVAATRLGRLSEEELRFELDLIERCLAAMQSKGDRS